MKSSPRGKAIIVNNKKFDKQDARPSSQMDVDRLNAAFRQLGFQVEIWSDLPAAVCTWRGFIISDVCYHSSISNWKWYSILSIVIPGKTLVCLSVWYEKVSYPGSGYANVGSEFGNSAL